MPLKYISTSAQVLADKKVYNTKSILSIRVFFKNTLKEDGAQLFEPQLYCISHGNKWKKINGGTLSSFTEQALKITHYNQ